MRPPRPDAKSPMVIGTTFEVGRSGLEVAGLINTGERILSALFSTGSKNGSLRSL